MVWSIATHTSGTLNADCYVGDKWMEITGF